LLHTLSLCASQCSGPVVHCPDLPFFLNIYEHAERDSCGAATSASLQDPRGHDAGSGAWPAAGAAHAPATDVAPQPTWLADLESYLATSFVPSEGRHDLAAAVRAAPSAPATWLAFLSAEEAAGGGALAGGLTGGLAVGGGGGGGGVSLYHLYYWATQLVPRAKHQGDEEYVRLWLGYARQQWCGARGEGPGARRRRARRVLTGKSLFTV
jgi:hypothetical protein